MRPHHASFSRRHNARPLLVSLLLLLLLALGLLLLLLLALRLTSLCCRHCWAL